MCVHQNPFTRSSTNETFRVSFLGSSLGSPYLVSPRQIKFVVNSPTLSSVKFWPGGLAHTCTHAVVFAQLLLPVVGTMEYQNKGIHAFMVSLRNQEHRRMPGVHTGDIGPKSGLFHESGCALSLQEQRVLHSLFALSHSYASLMMCTHKSQCHFIISRLISSNRLTL